MKTFTCYLLRDATGAPLFVGYYANGFEWRLHKMLALYADGTTVETLAVVDNHVLANGICTTKKKELGFTKKQLKPSFKQIKAPPPPPPSTRRILARFGEDPSGTNRFVTL